jgi:hypothetical protein
VGSSTSHSDVSLCGLLRTSPSPDIVPSLPSNGCRGLSDGWGMKFTTHPQIQSRGQEYVDVYISPYAFNAECLVKHEDNVNFYLYEVILILAVRISTTPILSTLNLAYISSKCPALAAFVHMVINCLPDPISLAPMMHSLWQSHRKLTQDFILRTFHYLTSH